MITQLTAFPTLRSTDNCVIVPDRKTFAQADIYLLFICCAFQRVLGYNSPFFRAPGRPRICVRKYGFKRAGISLVIAVIMTGCDRAPDGHAEHPGLSELIPHARDMNVLIISFDALRADALGLYGYGRDTSPNLDRFAEAALVFDNAWTASPTTPTSFAAAFTGRYPYRAFIGWELIPVVTLASMMREAGYHTFGLFNNVQLASKRNFGQGFDVYEAGNWSDDRTLEDARAMLNDAAGRRFFGWIHFISPHTPYEYREIAAHLAGEQADGRYAETTGGKFDVASDEELSRVRDLYDGEVWYADRLFGELIAHMESLGLMKDTLIIVTSDHGEEFMEHGQLQHNALYEEVVRIPMMIRHPGAAGGARTDAPYVNTDLLPTIASMAGLDYPTDIDGIDLFSPFDADRLRILTGMTNRKTRQIAAGRGSRKFILRCEPEPREELYDLAADPGEENNLVLDDPALAGEMFDALQAVTVADACRVIAGASRGRRPEEMLSPEQIEELKSLGYIQ